MKLVYKDTGIEVKIGDAATIREQEVIVTDIEEPRHAASTGRVYVKMEGFTMGRSYFPSVIGAEWVDRDDQ